MARCVMQQYLLQQSSATEKPEHKHATATLRYQAPRDPWGLQRSTYSPPHSYQKGKRLSKKPWAPPEGSAPTTSAAPPANQRVSPQQITLPLLLQ